MGPETFLEQFQAKSEDVPIAAAVALGLAGAGSVERYLPVIMQRLLADTAKDQYLLLHSLKEVSRFLAIIRSFAHMAARLFNTPIPQPQILSLTPMRCGLPSLQSRRMTTQRL